MHFSVCHDTQYRYPVPVRLAGHTMRLTPRVDGTRIHLQRLTIDPAPVAREDVTDSFGNRLTRLAFDGITDHLSIQSRFRLETLAPARLQAAEYPPLPWQLRVPPDIADYLPGTRQDASVVACAAGLTTSSRGQVRDFLTRLNQTLFTRTDRHIRPDGFAQTAAQTLASARGACRDLTVLFMAACRSLVIPARFVSGAQAHAESVDGRRHLHAWAEVFLPGTGWEGFDPTHGLPVTDGHVALCAAPEQAMTMPVEGGYFGDATSSTLDYDVRITTAP